MITTRVRTTGSNVLVLVLALLFLGSGALALPSSLRSPLSTGLEGDWKGAIEVPGTTLGIELAFTRTDGRLEGAIDIPIQGLEGYELTSIVVATDKITFALPGVPGNASFEGVLTEDDNVFEGVFSQGGGRFPVRLERVEGGAPATESTPTDPYEILAGFPEYATSVMEGRNVPGAAIAIVWKGELVYAEGLGLRDVEGKQPVTPETLFAIGSSSKAFTAALVGILVDDGLLDFDVPVRTYLSDFELYDDYATEHVTPRDLLTHVTGLPRHDLLWYGSGLSREELFARLRYLQPSVSFRQAWQYQNLMFMTAGLLAGRVADSTWEDLVGERIFEPLAIDYANFSVADLERVEDAALGYKDGEDGALERMDYRNIDAIGPAGSINANVVEMGNWLMLHLGQGEFLGKRVVSKGTMAQLHAPHAMIVRGKKDRHTPYSMYAMGWMVEPYRGHDLLHHGGNIDGFSALMTFLPDDELGIAVLTNKNGTPITSVLTYHVIDLMLGLSPLNHDARAGGGPPSSLAAAMAKEAVESGRVADTKPAHELSAYAGEYGHPGYGVATFTQEGESLHLEYGPFTGELEHWHFETFRAEGGVEITFETDPAGDVVGLSTKLEPTVAPIRFVRRASSLLTDPAFLARLEGEYDLSGRTCTVDAAGSRLRVTVPGQPTYSLEPHRGTSFRLKELQGYVLEFELEGDEVVAAVFHQPNGVFRATRKAGAPH